MVICGLEEGREVAENMTQRNPNYPPNLLQAGERKLGSLPAFTPSPSRLSLDMLCPLSGVRNRGPSDSTCSKPRSDF